LCVAKIIRLVGPIEPPARAEFHEEFATAAYLEQGTFVHPDTGKEERFVQLGTIRQELEAVPGPKIEKGCIDFIESLLVVDHTKRPTAREALKHPWLQDFDPDDVD
jgi:serine/threonine protein kinase